MSATDSSRVGCGTSDSLAAKLARDRLNHRARRVRLVIDQVDARARETAAAGELLPAPLHESLRDFRRLLGDIERQLAKPGTARRDPSRLATRVEADEPEGALP